LSRCEIIVELHAVKTYLIVRHDVTVKILLKFKNFKADGKNHVLIRM